MNDNAIAPHSSHAGGSADAGHQVVPTVDQTASSDSDQRNYERAMIRTCG